MSDEFEELLKEFGEEGGPRKEVVEEGGPRKEVEEVQRSTVEEREEIVEEEAPPTKLVFLIFGDKGTGKTTVSLSFPNEIAVLSFDRKAAIIKATRYKNDKRIHIYDVVKYMDYTTPLTTVNTAEVTYEYIMKVLRHLDKIKPDWIVIDGAEIFQQICEWTMRARHGLSAFQGISNLNLWKERRILIRNVHNKAYEIAKRGLIYTTFTTKDAIVIEGSVVTEKEVPKWIDVLIYETDFVLKTEQDITNRRFTVRVVTSKDDMLLPTGHVYDVTDRSFWQIVEEMRKNGGVEK